MQFIPARGRKRDHDQIPPCVFYCNLSPRGDGNRPCAVATYGAQLQFIPARGRKLVDDLEQTSIFIAIYPREGTETHTRRLFNFIQKLQFIPARGRKRTGSRSRPDQNRLQFIPARGRKLTRWACSFLIAIDCNLSPRGDGNRLSATT